MPPEPALVIIPVRSRRQALDWSLALISQGIAATIKHEAAGAGWQLEVSAQDGRKAFQTLRQYHQENRGWPWHDAIPLTRAHFDWFSVAWGLLLAWCFWLESVNPGFKRAGIMDTSAVLAGQWWRVFTAILLHADLAHLAGNLSIGILLFGLAMGRFGTGTGLLGGFFGGSGRQCRLPSSKCEAILRTRRVRNGHGRAGHVVGPNAALGWTFGRHREAKARRRGCGHHAVHALRPRARNRHGRASGRICDRACCWAWDWFSPRRNFSQPEDKHHFRSSAVDVAGRHLGTGADAELTAPSALTGIGLASILLVHVLSTQRLLYHPDKRFHFSPPDPFGPKSPTERNGDD